MNTKALAEQTNNIPEQWTGRDKKIRAEPDEIEIKTKYPESLKWSVSFFEKIKKVVKSLSKLSKIKRRPQYAHWCYNDMSANIANYFLIEFKTCLLK